MVYLSVLANSQGQDHSVKPVPRLPSTASTPLRLLRDDLSCLRQTCSSSTVKVAPAEFPLRLRAPKSKSDRKQPAVCWLVADVFDIRCVCNLLRISAEPLDCFQVEVRFCTNLRKSTQNTCNKHVSTNISKQQRTESPS